MVRELFPDRDREFAVAARTFAEAITRDPEQFFLSADDAQFISVHVKRYRDALARAIRRDTRTRRAIGEKDKARAEAEYIIRKYANIIRADDRIEPAVKEPIGVKERPKRLKKRTCPQVAPHLRFVGVDDAGHPGDGGIHLIEFTTQAIQYKSKAKPRGAARLELFFEFVKPGRPAPARPDALSGWPRYLRSFTTTPMRVKHPVPVEPMLLVYWARWADATGEVGPWSRTLVTRVEAAAEVIASHPTEDDENALKLAA